jgi:hypothetical protein
MASRNQIIAGVAAAAAGGLGIWYWFWGRKTDEDAPIKKELQATAGPAPTVPQQSSVSAADLQANAPPAPQPSQPSAAPPPAPAEPEEPVIVVGAVPPDVPLVGNEGELRNFMLGQVDTAEHPDDLDDWIKAQVEGLDPDHQIRKWLEA